MPTHENGEVQIGFCGDEMVSSVNTEAIKLYFQGGYSASNIGSVDNVYNKMYKGIRQCYMLKQNIGMVPGLSEDKINDYTTQADFLIAYYHSVLMMHYGPVILVKELPDVNTAIEDMLPRSPYDECVEWVTGLFDKVAETLPASREDSYYGLATSVAAKALKARVLLYAASPLFNGNSEYYSDFANPDGTLLMSQTYDKEKYKKAADAALEAINFAEAYGYRLYYASDESVGRTTCPYPEDDVERQLRFTYTDKVGNREVLWANTRKEYSYSIQGKSLPYLSFGGAWATSLTQVERFYTENGLPIDQDPEFDYENRYTTVDMGVQGTYEHGEGITLKLNIHREPRFYAWVAFHGGYYECQTEKTVANGTNGTTYQPQFDRSGGKGKRWLTQFRKTDQTGKMGRQNYSSTGYLNKKGHSHGTGVMEKCQGTLDGLFFGGR